ncbi:MAG: hypothetical protein C0514_01620 [Candidatus Puniceispirillum sp.]|nr:hypothetical protein [Candidatus Puniceispirillum sp.]
MKRLKFFFALLFFTGTSFGSCGDEILGADLSPELLAKLHSDHIHITFWDLHELLPLDEIRRIQKERGDCASMDAIERAHQGLAALIADQLKSTPAPTFLDIDGFHGDLAGALLPFLSAKNEDGSFRLTHLGLDGRVFCGLFQNPDTMYALTQNTNLRSLRLHRFLPQECYRGLQALTSLDELDLSSTYLRVAPDHHFMHYLLTGSLLSFKAPQSAHDEPAHLQAFLPALWQAEGIIDERRTTHGAEAQSASSLPPSFKPLPPIPSTIREL